MIFIGLCLQWVIFRRKNDPILITGLLITELSTGRAL